MKTLSTITALLVSAGVSFAANITVDNPTGFAGNITSQTFSQELGNYSASDFNANADTILINFDDAKFTTGDNATSVLFTSAEVGFDFRTNFGLVSGGFGRAISEDGQFVSSSPKSLIWGNGNGATITFTESVSNELVYGVGFTVTRLQIPVDIKLYSDEAGTVQIGSTITMSANSGDSGYSFFGFAGDTVIRRVDVDTNGLTNGFGIDDVIVTTAAIPEPSQQSMLLGGIVFGLIMLVRRFRKSRA